MEIKTTSEITVRIIDAMGGDHSVVASAKVSTSGAESLAFHGRAKENDNAYLINYLMKQRHGTPFEHNALQFYVHAPIFVWREWHRHRIGFSYNEESGRYKQLDPLFYLPPRERAMMKVEDWKPGRPKFLRCDSDDLYAEFCARKTREYQDAYESYEWAMQNGFDNGLARIDLPVAIYSGCWVTCNARSLMAFLSLRTHDETATFVSYPLYEIEVAARKVEDLFAERFPITYNAFVKHGRVGP